jgi:hypothetical protein
MLRFGRRRVPEAVHEVSLEPGERRLAWALRADGGVLVATDLGLWLPPSAGGPVVRLDWADVERVSWKRPVLTVLGIAAITGTGERRTVELQEGGDLPEVVRGLVTASIGWSAHYRLQPRGGVRVVGRRRPGREVLDWQLVYDADTDPGAPGVAEQAEQLRADARRTIG